jgi:acetolactate synthase-1/2/3 large subunit
MKASDYIVKFFEDKGVEYIFGYLGGMISYLADSISKSDRVKFIQVYHEQSGAIAAEGYARATNNIGVAISSSGPGVTNMITGIANAYFDSIPVIYITGQVNTYDYKYDKPIKQQGFQEINVVDLTKSITKYSKLIDKVEDLPYELAKSYEIAMDGRKGPVVLDLPLNIQRSDIELNVIKKYFFEKRSLYKIGNELLISIETIKNAKAPMFLLGAGFIASAKDNTFENIVDKTGIPVSSSLLGKSGFDNERKEYVGMIGSYGNRCANIAIFNSDCLIVLGSRLDNRQTGNLLNRFSANKKIIHVDIDKNELEYNRLENRIKLNMPVEEFIIYLEKHIGNYKVSDNWKRYIEEIKRKYSQEKEIEKHIENKLPYKFIEIINEFTNDGDIITSDIGQNQMWSAQCIKIKKGQQWYTSGGLAPMGYSLPAAVGAGFANRNKNIFSLMGDGGFHIALQSLMLISQYDLPIKVIVLNNESLGMIAQFQELYFDSRMTGTTKDGGYLVPKIDKLALSYGLKYFKIDKDIIKNKVILKNIFAEKNCIIEFIIPGLTKVSPKLEFDSSIENTSPKLSGIELKNSKFTEN